MMTEAYGYTIIAVIAALSIGIVRAAGIRPTVLAGLACIGIFALGYVVGVVSHHADEGWLRAGTVRPPPQPVGALSGEQVPVAPIETLANGLAVRKGDRIAIEIYDSSAVAVGNRPSVRLPRGGSLQIAGWAVDAVDGAPCKALYLAVGKSTTVTIPYGFARSDVAAYFKDPGYTSVGFSGKINTSKMPKGSNPVKVECLSTDGKTLYVSPDQRTLVLE